MDASLMWRDGGVILVVAVVAFMFAQLQSAPSMSQSCQEAGCSPGSSLHVNMK